MVAAPSAFGYDCVQSCDPCFPRLQNNMDSSGGSSVIVCSDPHPSEQIRAPCLEQLPADRYDGEIIGRQGFGARQYGVGFAGFSIANSGIRELPGSGRQRPNGWLEPALDGTCRMPADGSLPNRKIRDRLVEEPAGYSLRLFVVQREACGLNKIDHVMQEYGVPNEVHARHGAIGDAASIRPAKTMRG